MDFDPSAFLSMDMTEDQDSVYTAPDLPQRFSAAMVPQGKIVVEGGLQMEQGMQIPVPVFGLLQPNEPMEEGVSIEDDAAGKTEVEAPVHIDMTELESSTTPQPSPGERTSSPCTTKKVYWTHDESRFRKELYCGHYERVKIFRLHCTICDKHLGCAPWYTERYMRLHKLLSVAVCRKCFEFYGDINFPIEEGAEMYCCWCGEGGECFCCSTCPKIVCKKCIKRNFGVRKVKEIDKNDDWSCFVCKPEDIWPHRAMMWGLQRWGKGMRQLVAMLPKEEKQAKLSMDTSQCCLKQNQGFTPVGLPPKAVLAKVPLGMIAPPYQRNVKEVLAHQDTIVSTSNGIYVPSNMANNQVSHGVPPMNSLRPLTPQTLTRVPGNLSRHVPSPSFGYHIRHQMQQVIQRNSTVMNRPASPYPMNRNMPPVLRRGLPPQPPQTCQYPQGMALNQAQQFPFKIHPPLGITTPSHPSQLIDIERESLLHRALKPTQCDTSALESGVRDAKDALRPTLMMLDQFNVIKNDLANDFAKLTSFSERLSYNIKIAICNLAKVNTDLIESQKKIIDSRVSTVVSNIQSAIDNKVQSGVVNNIAITAVNGTLNPIIQNGIESSPKRSNSYLIDSSPEIIEVNPNSPSRTPEPNTSISSNIEQTIPATPSSSTEEVEDLAITMLCETVFEVEENKENKDDANKDDVSKDQCTPVKAPQPVINKDVKGKPNSKNNLRKRQFDQISSSKIQVIDLIDDDDVKQESFDESYYCTKFNIVPCKVILKRLKRDV